MLYANILHGRDFLEVFSWQQSVTIQTLCHSVVSLIWLLLTVSSHFGSCMGLVKGRVQRREELKSESAGPLCLRIAHTHPSGVSAELTALSTVWGALCVSLHCLLA